MPRFGFLIAFATALIGTPGAATPAAAAAAAASTGSAAVSAQAIPLAAAHADSGAGQFRAHCARCHGPQGYGAAKQAIPALAGQRYTYLVAQLGNFAAGARDSDTMHRVVSQKALREPQVRADIAAYLNAAEPSTLPATGDGADVALGRGIFHEQCAACHGADARGSEAAAVPSLRHQHYSYLVAQIHMIAAGYRHNIDENLEFFLRSLDERDVSATADYLSRLH